MSKLMELVEMYGIACLRAADNERAVYAEIRARLEELERDAAEAERKRLLAMLDASIKKGHLPGNGWDETAQRNGMVLAYNLLFDAAMEAANVPER